VDSFTDYASVVDEVTSLLLLDFKGIPLLLTSVMWMKLLIVLHGL